jgi:hypothetical protein
MPPTALPAMNDVGCSIAGRARRGRRRSDYRADERPTALGHDRGGNDDRHRIVIWSANSNKITT